MSAMRIWAAAAGVWLAAAAAGATSFTPEVDFRGAEYATGHDLASLLALAGGHNFELSALEEAGGSLVLGGALSWSAEDGFGISSGSYEHDEVEGSERLRLHFAEPVFLERLLISDLFQESFAEVGAFSTDGGATWISFIADGVSPNGELEVPVHATAQTLLFSAAGRFAGENHEFALAGFDANRIVDVNQIPHTPEPASGLLVAVGLLALARRARS